MSQAVPEMIDEDMTMEFRTWHDTSMLRSFQNSKEFLPVFKEPNDENKIRMKNRVSINSMQ